MISTIDGVTHNPDIRSERIAAGTVGGEHIVPQGITGLQTSGRISMFDPRVTISPLALWVAELGRPNDYMGLGVNSLISGSTATVKFTGTSISVIGAKFAGGASATVMVDGVATAGRLSVSNILDPTIYTFGSALPAADTTVFVIDTTGFDASGSIIIDSEIIAYSGKTGTSFTGCTRSGVNTHSAFSTVYAYSSSFSTDTTYRDSRSTLWSNNRLSPGAHTLVITTTGSGLVELFLEGFIVGGLIGATSVNTYVRTITQTISFDAASNSINPGSIPYIPTTEAQALAPLGAAAYSGSTYKPCFVSYDALTDVYHFYCPLGASSTLTVVLSILMLGPGS